jgi:hypothetical protein
MGGTLTLMRIGKIRDKYALVLLGKERFGLAGFVCCTLLGPEGPEPPGEPGWDCTSGPSPVGRTVMVAGGVGTARTLRTTQWTRAS